MLSNEEITLEPIEITKETDTENTDDSLDWEIVENTFRTLPRTAMLVNEVTEALLDNKTIKVPIDQRTDKIYRWAKANNYEFHRRAFGKFAVIWIDRPSAVEK